MDLPNPFSASKNSEPPEKVIGILLSQTKVQALLLRISETKLLLESASEIIEYTDIKNCPIQTDEALQQLGPESEGVDAVVFGLEHGWVAGGEVVDQHQPLLSKITEELALKPVGFIDTSEALIQHHLAQNSLYSGIFLLFSHTAMTVNYVSQGKIRGVEQVGRSESVIADLREGLARFSKQVEDEQFYLPAKLILASFDLTEAELSEIQQDLLEFSWTEHARFLQMPTIQIITDEEFTGMAAIEAARAAAIAAGYHAAAAVANGSALGAEAAATSKEMGFSEVAAAPLPTPTPPPEAGAAEAAATAETAVAEPESDLFQPGDSAGAAEETAVAATAAPTTATSFGIPISSDKITAGGKSLDQLDQEAEAKNPSQPADDLAKAGFFTNLRARWNEPYKGKRSLKFFILTGFVSGLLVIALALAAIISFSAQAVVELEYNLLPVIKNATITVDPAANAPDPERLVLPGRAVTKTVSGQETAASTGTTIVGDEAKGTITLYNKTSARKTFAKGTVVSSGDLNFTLDDEVSVASASVKEKQGGNETEYGKADVAVTATDIGDNYNLSEGTELTVDNFAKDTYAATIAKGGFTGGASREVQVVSANDLANLREGLRAKLLAQANEELKEDYKNGIHVFPTAKIVNETAEFDAEEADEVTSFALALNLTVEALTYNTNDSRALAAEVLASEIPDHYELSDQEPRVMSDEVENNASESATVQLNAQFEAYAHPIFDETTMAATLAGKKLVEAKSELERSEEIKSVEFYWRPSLAARLRQSLPNQEKITITVKTKE